ncbi:MAG TPA: glycosyltransferase family 4 protein [Solirubrobacteraceae bacterium]
MTPRRLLAVGQALNASGYGRVMESLLPRLCGALDVVLFAPGRHGPAQRRDGVEIRGSTIAGDPFGRVGLPPLLAELDPDVVLVQADAALFPMYADVLGPYAGVTVAYCPVDWPEVPPSIADALNAFDSVVAYTEFGRDALARAGVRASDVIPHGVDTTRFAPAGERAGDRFVVLNANRNLHRKRIDLTIEGFALFARNRPRARLHLHMGPQDQGCDVRALVAQLGIEDRVALTPSNGRRPHVTDEELAAIYNAAHVGINTCAAEGFGLVAFEHAATGAPQIVPDHSACGELWRDHGLLLPADPAPRDVAAALARLHDDPALGADLGRRALDHARDPRFSWDAIAARWAALLEAHWTDVGVRLTPADLAVRPRSGLGSAERR